MSHHPNDPNYPHSPQYPDRAWAPIPQHQTPPGVPVRWGSDADPSGRGAFRGGGRAGQIPGTRGGHPALSAPPRSTSDTRFSRGGEDAYGHRRPKEAPPRHNLIICMPLSIPSGEICITRDSGDNFYEFDDSQRNAQILFSNDKGVCDVWASFLQVRLGMIHGVPTSEIPRVVQVFHEAMSDTASEWEGKRESLDAIEIVCEGVLEIDGRDLSQDNTGNKHAVTMCETFGKLTSTGKENLKKIRRKVKRFALSLTLEFGLSMAIIQFPLRREHVKTAHLKMIADALDCEGANIRDDAFRVLLTAMSRGILPAKIPEPYRSASIDRQEWPIDTNQTPQWARVLPVRSCPAPHLSPDLMSVNLLDNVRKTDKDLRILIREWGLLEDPELKGVLKVPIDGNQVTVPNVLMGEVRIEHTHKKMMDPRWPTGFVLTRQMAGEEDPRRWAEVDAGGRPRSTKGRNFDEGGVESGDLNVINSSLVQARYVFAETPVPRCKEPPQDLLESFMRRWKKVFTRGVPGQSGSVLLH